MANYFVDTALGSGADDGSSMDAAKRGTSGIKTAMEVDHAEGTYVWFRRTCAYDEGVVGLNADIAPTADGVADSPVYFISWPRPAIANTTITQADWTNGSTTIDNIVGITCARTAHQARWCTAPNGKKYFITRVVDASTVIIDREYSGTTVTGTSGLFAIDQDDYYDIAQAIDDSAWTIKKADWNADPHDLPTIDFNSEAYQLAISGDNYLVFQGFNFIDSADTVGIVATGSTRTTLFNVMFKQNSSNTMILAIGATTYLKNFTIEGSGAGNVQRGINATNINRIMNGAIYNCGSYAIQIGMSMFISNVNLGVEIANGASEINLVNDAAITGFDVLLGGTNGYISTVSAPYFTKLCFENYQKVLGKHQTYYYHTGPSESIAVTSTNANKKLSDTVLKITPNINSVFVVNEWKQIIFDGSFELAAGSQTIKFWLFNDLGQTLNDTTATDNVYLEAEYVDSYDDVTEYTMTKAYSTEIDIADATDADDWNYLQVTVNPATASKVRVRLIVTAYDAADYFLVDPKPVIT